MRTLANLGFLWIMQRSPSSRAEKVMAGYEQRPPNFKRSMIPFTDKGAEQLDDMLSGDVEIGDNDKIDVEVTSVKFHEIGATSEPKYADEKKVIAKHRDGKTLVKLAEKVGYLGDGDLDETNVEFLKSIKAFKTALLAKSL